MHGPASCRSDDAWSGALGRVADLHAATDGDTEEVVTLAGNGDLLRSRRESRSIGGASLMSSANGEMTGSVKHRDLFHGVWGRAFAYCGVEPTEVPAEDGEAAGAVSSGVVDPYLLAVCLVQPHGQSGASAARGAMERHVTGRDRRCKP